MTLLEFIFKLILQFVPISETRILQLEEDAKIWYNDNVTNPNNEAAKLEQGYKPPNKIVETLIEHGEKWYTQTGFAILYLFAVKWIHNFKNEVTHEDE